MKRWLPWVALAIVVPIAGTFLARKPPTPTRAQRSRRRLWAVE